MTNIASVVDFRTITEAEPDTIARLRSLMEAQSAARGKRSADTVRKLIAAGAWTDAALALVEAELPHWRLRRLIYDDGEWHCALSRQHALPDWLDQSADGHHAKLPLAILNAIGAAKQQVADRVTSGVPSVLPSHTHLCDILACDNHR